MSRRGVLLGLAASAVCGSAALAQNAADRAVGPCSPVAGPEGDIPSEMPGCRRRHRPSEGSLDDEMAFRRGRRRAPDPPSWQDPE